MGGVVSWVGEQVDKVTERPLESLLDIGTFGMTDITGLSDDIDQKTETFFEDIDAAEAMAAAGIIAGTVATAGMATPWMIGAGLAGGAMGYTQGAQLDVAHEQGKMQEQMFAKQEKSQAEALANAERQKRQTAAEKKASSDLLTSRSRRPASRSGRGSTISTGKLGIGSSGAERKSLLGL